ncbi:aspartate aminotransferase, putative [Plasmodium gallinaceum]|uniref:Aspartate aminotransferase n=1 Tax=Plasmodium gallinaceum TaxID=5849 RepID=A0A1J1GWN8_PLAGA|nr:aspartate aminotransferase, putative [Plasmodium gallinaceum]CRG95429.1 aspartate aminotransferase, putative [Plasmodium gallinaceum]
MDNVLSKLKEFEPDSILTSTREFTKDKSEKKVNLSIGICCNEDGGLHVFKSVLEAEKLILEKNKEKPYLLSNGSKEFSILTQKLIFGENSEYMKEKRICTIQTIGGTGAIFIILEFLRGFNIESIYVTNIPYVNHVYMLKSFGFNVKYLNYFDPELIDINYELFLNDLRNIKNNSNILLQVCCYNPCSVDIEEKYFDEIADIVLKKNHLVIFDVAYQGLGNSDLGKDVLLIRKFQERKISFTVCQSFSKNMSLYGERAGALHIVCKNKTERQLLFNNLRMIIRRFYTSPIIHTNRIVCEVLKNEKLKSQWLKDLYELSERIKNNRFLFFDKLKYYQKKYNLNYDWDVYKKQKGIFSFIPIFGNIYMKLREYHIYIIDSGRINISGITKKNVDYIAEKICLCLSEL